MRTVKDRDINARHILLRDPDGVRDDLAGMVTAVGREELGDLVRLAVDGDLCDRGVLVVVLAVEADFDGCAGGGHGGEVVVWRTGLSSRYERFVNAWKGLFRIDAHLLERRPGLGLYRRRSGRQAALGLDLGSPLRNPQRRHEYILFSYGGVHVAFERGVNVRDGACSYTFGEIYACRCCASSGNVHAR